ncbi:MAG: hypothetical protein ACI9CF_001975 [Candidatus Omnitrophota bacterium]
MQVLFTVNSASAAASAANAVELIPMSGRANNIVHKCVLNRFMDNPPV